MSNHIETAVTIGISAQFEWLEKFIDAIYSVGVIYVHPLNKPVIWNGEILLEKISARVYFEQYIHQVQAAVKFADEPPMLTWMVENIGYDVSIDSQPGYLRWVMYLPPNKKCKDKKCYYSDFEYYLFLLLKMMREFPILAIATDEDCYADDLDWAHKEGKWWGIKLQIPQEKESFQMLDAIIAPALCNKLLCELVEKSAIQGYHFFPVGCENDSATHIITQLSKNPEHVLYWKYVCGLVTYDVRVSPMNEGFATRLFFRTQRQISMPYVDELAQHVLALINDYIILQFVTFDSRYNYFISR